MRTLLALLCGSTLLSGADQLREWAAWSPLSSRLPEIYPDEQLPNSEEAHGWYMQAAVFAGAPKRLNGIRLIEREDDELPVDGHVVINYIFEAEHGYTQTYDYFFNWGGTSKRRQIYARAGTDMQSERSGEFQGAIGVANWVSSSAPVGYWFEVSYSDEREYAFQSDITCCIFHWAAEIDDEQSIHRVGVQQRWHGGPMAETPNRSPFSYLVAVDAVYGKQDGMDRENGFRADFAMSWRLGNNYLIGAHITYTDLAYDREEGRVNLMTAQLGLGFTY